MRVALIQMCSGTVPADNLTAMERAVAEAAAAGATYVQTPEMAIAYVDGPQALAKVAQPFARNPFLARTAALALRHRVCLQIGSIAIATDTGILNRSVVFTSTGMMAATYDKIHLFDAALPDLEPYRESALYQAGERAVVTTAPGFPLGLSICYDLRFPHLYRAMAEAGAQVLAVPSAFTATTGEAHWEVLLRARAIETGSFVLAAAQGGQHANGRRTYGRSMIVGPWGEVIASAPDDRPQIVHAEIDLGHVAEARQKIPALGHARAFSIEKR